MIVAIALSAMLGLAVGWVGGRLLVLEHRGGIPGDLLAGVAGSVAGALLVRTYMTNDGGIALMSGLGGVAGALVATFTRRAFADRYQRAHV